MCTTLIFGKATQRGRYNAVYGVQTPSKVSALAAAAACPADLLAGTDTVTAEAVLYHAKDDIEGNQAGK